MSGFYRSNSPTIITTTNTNTTTSSSSSGFTNSSSRPTPTFTRSRSIKSEEQLDLHGPLEVAGSVKSGSSINFEGDFIVRDKVDAYGAIAIDGSVSCELSVPTAALRYASKTDTCRARGRIKAYGNILVNGHLAARYVGPPAKAKPSD